MLRILELQVHMWHTRRSILCTFIWARWPFSFSSLARDQHGFGPPTGPGLTRELGFHLWIPWEPLRQIQLNSWAFYSNAATFDNLELYSLSLFIFLLPLSTRTWNMGNRCQSCEFTFGGTSSATLAMGCIRLSTKIFSWSKSRQQVTATGVWDTFWRWYSSIDVT